jgi:hypothetical protein
LGSDLGLGSGFDAVAVGRGVGRGVPAPGVVFGLGSAAFGSGGSAGFGSDASAVVGG